MNRLHSDGGNNVDGEVMHQVSRLMGIDTSNFPDYALKVMVYQKQ